MKQDEYHVSFANFDCIPYILNLLEQNLFENKQTYSEERLTNEGFIYYRFTANDLRTWLLQPEFILLVCKKNDEILGYSIGCDFESIPHHMQASLITLIEGAGSCSSRRLFYHKEIVTAQGGHGIGGMIMNKLFQKTSKLGFTHIVCLIAESPHHNDKSIQFHQKMGFEYVGSLRDHSTSDGVYLKKL